MRLVLVLFAAACGSAAPAAPTPATEAPTASAPAAPAPAAPAPAAPAPSASPPSAPAPSASPSAASQPSASPPSAPAVPLSNKRESPPAAHELAARLERTACFGWCPIYKVTIFRDGVVEYEGERFVKLQGRATGHIGPARLAALDELFQDHGYLRLKDSYEDYGVTDMPSAYSSYAPDGGKPKSIKHYFGDRTAPKALVEVEDGIDRIVHIEQWIGTEDERRRLRHR